jgi:dimethylsulfoniopropionate demethylase
MTMFNNENKEIGKLRSAGFSPKFEKIVGIAMVKKGFWETSQKFKINIDGNFVFGEICNLPIV